jgi:hypothetical protein
MDIFGKKQEVIVFSFYSNQCSDFSLDISGLVSIFKINLPMSENKTELKRSLGLIDATSLVAGSMIGSGILL